MLRNILGRICRNSGGLVVVAGAVGVLTGVKHLMRSYAICSGTSTARAGVAEADTHQRITALQRDYFTIRRSRLERGYTYWVLQGFGKYRCFVLCDTWREATDEAIARLKSGYLSEGQLELVNVGRRG